MTKKFTELCKKNHHNTFDLAHHFVRFWTTSKHTKLVTPTLVSGLLLCAALDLGWSGPASSNARKLELRLVRPRFQKFLTHSIYAFFHSDNSNCVTIKKNCKNLCNAISGFLEFQLERLPNLSSTR